jgi:phosphopantetheinyl transferase
MQAVESQTLILYHTDLRGEWPAAAAQRLRARLRYGKRLASAGEGAAARATLAGIALALHALARLTGHAVAPGELLFGRGTKPRLADAGATPDFSISHAGPWVGCAAVRRGRVGFDVELGTDARIREWVACEAALKGAGVGVAALAEVELSARAARCRGTRWHAQRPRLFAGAAACVMTDAILPRLTAHAVPLGELFAL